jgi:hypothetical protein
LKKCGKALPTPFNSNKWYPFAIVEMDLKVDGNIKLDDSEGTVYEGVVTVFES